ncbi:hypothetical protein IWZ01DRAFT_545913 [Phyllosticta capitalensis]
MGRFGIFVNHRDAIGKGLCQRNFGVYPAAFGRMYRKANIVLRFIIGDALAFCHTFAARQSDFPILNGLPRGPMTLKPMNLDSTDYLYFQPGSEGQFFNAPIVLNSIDGLD